MSEFPQVDPGTPWVRPPNPQDEAAERVARDDTVDEPTKIDQIAEIRRWFRGDNEAIPAYLGSEMDVATAVEKIAKPIEEAYSSADYGRKDATTEPDPATADLPSTESQLWELWYSVLHAAKKIPWEADAAQQEKLLALVQALKARPNPPRPARFEALKGKEWVLGSETVWSRLLMLGPSARETWNDSCGCGAGWLIPEQHAWINVNAFVARLTATGTHNFGLYGVWVLRDALEQKLGGDGHHHPAPVLVQRHLLLTIASIWIKIAGSYMAAERVKYNVNLPKDTQVDLAARGRKLPWDGKNRDTLLLCTARWEFWAGRFEQEAQDQELSTGVRGCARESAENIRRLLAPT
ncbi:hypothetical protein F5Y04DRAFT_256621 [Hypomontagnella monticulosa]|nr:hypothetical protein F5Y04DRAFT_256621 [Hypomontagnella monticulosa]